MQILRIMRQFMTHSNKAPIALSTQPQDARSATTLPQVPLDYQIARSRRKTLAVHVRHGIVEVRAPLFVGDGEITRFVEAHRQWIVRKLELKSAQNAQRLDLRQGGQIFYKGRNLSIELVRGARESIETTATLFILTCRDDKGAGPARSLQRCLLQQAADVLPERTRALAAYLGAAERLQDVVFRKTKTKWGHCTSAGTIQYNWLIMLAPDAIIDYMICHEVSHLRVMNHSAKFWVLVESMCPDYRIYVKWLRKHEHRLWL